MNSGPVGFEGWHDFGNGPGNWTSDTVNIYIEDLKIIFRQLFSVLLQIQDVFFGERQTKTRLPVYAEYAQWPPPEYPEFDDIHLDDLVEVPIRGSGGQIISWEYVNRHNRYCLMLEQEIIFMLGGYGGVRFCDPEDFIAGLPSDRLDAFTTFMNRTGVPYDPYPYSVQQSRRILNIRKILDQMRYLRWGCTPWMQLDPHEGYFTGDPFVFDVIAYSYATYNDSAGLADERIANSLLANEPATHGYGIRFVSDGTNVTLTNLRTGKSSVQTVAEFKTSGALKYCTGVHAYTLNGIRSADSLSYNHIRKATSPYFLAPPLRIAGARVAAYQSIDGRVMFSGIQDNRDIPPTPAYHSGCGNIQLQTSLVYDPDSPALFRYRDTMLGDRIITVYRESDADHTQFGEYYPVAYLVEQPPDWCSEVTPVTCSIGYVNHPAYANDKPYVRWSAKLQYEAGSFIVTDVKDLVDPSVVA